MPLARTLFATTAALALSAATADEPVGTVIGIDLGTTYSVRGVISKKTCHSAVCLPVILAR
eukprot:COSAG01_NODE_9399_length_2455_cov_45.735993_3_plen_61_part_00